MFCPSCGSQLREGAQFCPQCGAQVQTESGTRVLPVDQSNRPGASAGRADVPSQPKRQGRGCLGWGCLITSSFLVLVLLVGAVGTAMVLRVPQRLGIVQPPAERILSGAPDREAASSVLAELEKGGVDTRGIDVYVIPITGGKGSLLSVSLDSSKGFHFTATRQDPVIDYLTRLAKGEAIRQNDITRLAVDYRDDNGDSLLTITAPTSAVAAFADGKITREQFFQETEGKIDPSKLYGEVLQ